MEGKRKRKDEKRRTEAKNGVHKGMLDMSEAILCMSGSVHKQLLVLSPRAPERGYPRASGRHSLKGLISRKVTICRFSYFSSGIRVHRGSLGFSGD